MREKVLQWAWQKGLIQGKASGVKHLAIHSLGTWNLHHPGPDFLNASIEMDGILWHGSVEIHGNSSDWYKHKHHLDAKYSNVILHVVVTNDRPVIHHGKEIPTLIVDATVVQWLTILKDPTASVLPCSHFKRSFSADTITSFWEKRIQRKRKERPAFVLLAQYILHKSSVLPPLTLSSRQRKLQHYHASVVRARDLLTPTEEPTYSHEKLLQLWTHLQNSGMTFFEIHQLLLNGFVPLLWNAQNNQELQAYSQSLPAETNTVLRKFKATGNIPKNAFESQAIMEIYKELCSNKACLTCEMGQHMLTT